MQGSGPKHEEVIDMKEYYEQLNAYAAAALSGLTAAKAGNPPFCPDALAKDAFRIAQRMMLEQRRLAEEAGPREDQENGSGPESLREYVTGKVAAQLSGGFKRCIRKNADTKGGEAARRGWRELKPIREKMAKAILDMSDVVYDDKMDTLAALDFVDTVANAAGAVMARAWLHGLLQDPDSLERRSREALKYEVICALPDGRICLKVLEVLRSHYPD